MSKEASHEPACDRHRFRYDDFSPCWTEPGRRGPGAEEVFAYPTSSPHCERASSPDPDGTLSAFIFSATQAVCGPRWKAAGREKTGDVVFFGFARYCGSRFKTGTFTVWRITAKTRMAAKLKAVKAELRRRMHDRPAKTGAWLRKVVVGYYQYHAVPGNIGTTEHLPAARQSTVVPSTRTSQSTGTQTVGNSHSDVRKGLDTASESPASISRRSLLRHSSFIRAVCVDALVRICAGAISNDRPYCGPELRVPA